MDMRRGALDRHPLRALGEGARGGMRMGRTLLSLSGIWPLGAFAPGMAAFRARSGLVFILQQDIENNRVFSSLRPFYEPASNSVPVSPGEVAANFFLHLLHMPWVGFLNKAFNIHRLNYVVKKGPLVPPV